MSGAPHDATFLDMRMSGGDVTLLVKVRDEALPVELEVQPDALPALRHIHDFHSRLGGEAHVGVLVDLLMRCLGSLGVLALAVVVVADRPARFYLRLLRPCAGEIHLDLNVVDAACLLLSRRLAVQVEGHASRNWDVALHRLIDQGHRRQV